MNCPNSDQISSGNPVFKFGQVFFRYYPTQMVIQSSSVERVREDKFLIHALYLVSSLLFVRFCRFISDFNFPLLIRFLIASFSYITGRLSTISSNKCFSSIISYLFIRLGDIRDQDTYHTSAMLSCYRPCLWMFHRWPMIYTRS